MDAKIRTRCESNLEIEGLVYGIKTTKARCLNPLLARKLMSLVNDSISTPNFCIV